MKNKNEYYFKRFEDEILVGTTSLSEMSSDFGDTLQNGFVHRSNSQQLLEPDEAVPVLCSDAEQFA